MADVVFFLKSVASKSLYDLAWPNEVSLVAVDPPESLMCSGTDPRCSSAYSRMYTSLKDADGRVLPNFVKKYYGTSLDQVGHIVFLGFSAAHGFLNPLARVQADRERISAYLLLDATFGGGKDAYAAFLRDAAAGERLLVSPTSNSGGSADFEKVVLASEIPLVQVPAREPMPEASGGVYQLGMFGFWYRFMNATGGTEILHGQMPKLIRPMLEAYLVPYLRGDLAAGCLLEADGTCVPVPPGPVMAASRRESSTPLVVSAGVGAGLGALAEGLPGAVLGALLGTLLGAALKR